MTKSARPVDAGRILLKQSHAERLSRQLGSDVDLHFEPRQQIAGRPDSRGQVFILAIYRGVYELFIDGTGHPSANLISIDGRRGRLTRLVAARLRREARFYERLAGRVEGGVA